MANDMTIAIEFKAFDKFGKVTQKLNTQLKTIGKTSKKVKTSMDRMKSSAGKLNASFNRLAIVGFGALTLGMRKVIMVGAEFEESISKLSALTGLQGDKLKQLGDGALDMGQKWGMAGSQVADAMVKVGSNQPELLKNVEAMKMVTDASIKMAKISGLDVPTAANALTTSMNIFNKTAEESAEILDIMAVMAVKGTSPIQHQAMAMREAGGAAEGFGFNVNNLSAMIQVLGKKGLHGARAGRMLRNTFAAMNKASNGLVKDMPSAVKWLEKYGQSSTFAEDAIKDFGARNFVAITALAKQIPLLKEMNKLSFEKGYADKQAAVRMATLTAKWNQFKTAVGNSAIKIFNKSLKEPLKKVVDLMTKFAKWIGSGSKSSRLFISALTGIAVGITAIGSAIALFKFGALIKLVGGFMTLLWKAKPILAGLTGGVSIIASILASIGMYAITAGSGVEKVGKPINDLRDDTTSLGEAFDKVLESFSRFSDALFNFLPNVGNFGKVFSKVFDDVLKNLTPLLLGLERVMIWMTKIASKANISLFDDEDAKKTLNEARKASIENKKKRHQWMRGGFGEGGVAPWESTGTITAPKSPLSAEERLSTLRADFDPIRLMQDKKALEIHFANLPAPISKVDGDTKETTVTGQVNLPMGSTTQGL